MIRIFALPGAGSSAITYYRWIPHLPSGFVISPLDLPGRGMKIKEEKILENARLIDYLHQAIVDKMQGKEQEEYVLIGNSFSSILAIQLCKKIEEKQQIKTPLRLFVAVEPPPTILATRKKVSEDPMQKAFIEQVLERFFEDGVTSEHMRKRATDLVLKKLYEDKEAFHQLKAEALYQELYPGQEAIQKESMELLTFLLEHIGLFLGDEDMIHEVSSENLTVSTDIDAFGATNDSIANEKELREWEAFTTGNFRVSMFNGDHTILYDNPKIIIDQMKEVLRYS